MTPVSLTDIDGVSGVYRPNPEALAQARKTWTFLYANADTRTGTETIGVASKVTTADATVFPRRTVVSADAAFEHAEESPDYELTRLLGRGGMGEVWQARQPALNRAVAVKLSGTSANSVSERARFAAEARITSALKHPGIVVLHELAVTQDGTLFYAMQENVGALWSRVLPTNSRKQNLDIFEKVVQAVAFAHSKGVIHRDIKPSNVLLGEHGEVVLSDWGLALSMVSDGVAPTPAPQNALAGTPSYMAPEQALGLWKETGFATDLYLLGAMLYEVLTGKPPHRGEDTVSCLSAAAHNDIFPTRIKTASIFVALKAMASRPRDRYASATDFLEAVTAARKREAEQQPRRIAERIVRIGKRGIGTLFFASLVSIAALLVLANVTGDYAIWNRLTSPIQFLWRKSSKIRSDEIILPQEIPSVVMTASGGNSLAVSDRTTIALEDTKRKLQGEIRELEKERKLAALPPDSPAAIVRRYLETYVWRDRLKYVLRPEVVVAKMEKYYDRPGNRTRMIYPLMDLDVVRETKEPDVDGYIQLRVNYTVYEVARERELGETFWLKKDDDAWKIDWERLRNPVMR